MRVSDLRLSIVEASIRDPDVIPPPLPYTEGWECVSFCRDQIIENGRGDLPVQVLKHVVEFESEAWYGTHARQQYQCQ
jgi:hypothetical protein